MNSVGKYDTALVLGLGVSGSAAARLLKEEGTAVTAVDSRSDSGTVESSGRLRSEGIQAFAGCRSLPDGHFDVCVVSPGIPADSLWVKEAEKRGMETIPEIELGLGRCAGETVAVTGTNGKSTLVKLCGETLAAAGKRTAVAGNYGTAVSRAALENPGLDWLVLEVSSFQLELVKSFRPRVGVLMNIQADHLDRHGNMAAYTSIKSRMFSLMTPGDTGIVAEENLEEVQRLSRGANRWASFGLSEGADYRYVGGKVKIHGIDENSHGREIPFTGTVFDNDVMGRTAAAACAVAEACGEDARLAARAAAGYEPLPHRMNCVCVRNGVRYINDSKSTNMASLIAGVDMCGPGIRLIAGGRLKERDVEYVGDVLKGRVNKAYLIGECADLLFKAWAKNLECEDCGTLAKAVCLCADEAVENETVLFSPGCASFDQYAGFEERGERFVGEVKNLQ